MAQHNYIFRLMQHPFNRYGQRAFILWRRRVAGIQCPYSFRKTCPAKQGLRLLFVHGSEIDESLL